jgi:hypothetical protein
VTHAALRPCASSKIRFSCTYDDPVPPWPGTENIEAPAEGWHEPPDPNTIAGLAAEATPGSPSPSGRGYRERRSLRQVEPPSSPRLQATFKWEQSGRERGLSASSTTPRRASGSTCPKNSPSRNPPAEPKHQDHPEPPTRAPARSLPCRTDPRLHQPRATLVKDTTNAQDLARQDHRPPDNPANRRNPPRGETTLNNPGASSARAANSTTVSTAGPGGRILGLARSMSVEFA